MARLRPTEQFTGLTLEQWQADPSNIAWAQQEPRFRMMLSVLLNESRLPLDTAAGCSEGRAFGRVEGFNQALEVLRSLGRGKAKPPRDPEPTFDEPIALQTKEAYD